MFKKSNMRELGSRYRFFLYDRKGQAVRTVRRGLCGYIEDAGTGYTFTGEKLRVTHALL